MVVGFYDEEGNVRVVSVAPDSPAVSLVMSIRSPTLPFDAHNCISLGLTSSKDVHLVFGAHASAAYYVAIEADRSGHLNAAVHEPTSLPGRNIEQFTYPTFVYTENLSELKLIYRSGGSQHGEICIKRWDSVSKKYNDDELPLISGAFPGGAAGPYLNSPVTTVGGQTYCFYVWRLPEKATSAGAVVNVGIDFLKSEDGLRTLYTYEGVEIRRPVTPASSPRVFSVPLGSSLMNQGSAAARFDGAPMAMTYWSELGQPPQYRLVWREGGTWLSSVISEFRTPFDLDGKGTLALPHSRPEMVIDEAGNVLCIFRSIEFDGRLMLRVLKYPHYRLSDSYTRILFDDDLRQYEPVIDRDFWARSGILRAYVQPCDQSSGDQHEVHRSEIAYLCEWAPDY